VIISELYLSDSRKMSPIPNHLFLCCITKNKLSDNSGFCQVGHSQTYELMQFSDYLCKCFLSYRSVWF